MAQRVTLRKRQPYNTTSSRRRIVKTPGGILRYHHHQTPYCAKCGDCGSKLSGVVALRPREYATVSKTKKHVSRAYGGSRCGGCVRSRIVRAFLIEEAKVVKRVIKSQQKPLLYEVL
ncbi:ribosomal protein L34e [Lactarius hengduanensis]|nr:ribosomal protein L34e [Lactarius hengduanensis]